MNIEGKKISIIGAAKSGIAAAKLAKIKGAFPFVSDSSSKEELSEQANVLAQENISFEFGGHTDRAIDTDFIVVSPGVPNNTEFLLNAKSIGIKIFSEIEFASWFCKGKIIAITGTNGKTTTTNLCAHVFDTAGIKCYKAGNIGTAFSEIVCNIEENQYVALEVSSFQLDNIYKFKPDCSVILNIAPDHLDRYNNNFNNYKSSKLNIFLNQDEKNLFVFNAEDKNLNDIIIPNAIQKKSFATNNFYKADAYSNNGKLIYVDENKTEEICSIEDLLIKGKHNIANALSVVIIAKYYGIDKTYIKKGLSTFEAVEHRLELVKKINKVEYVNDSKATNINSVWYALQSFDKPIHLILGGKDKGNNYDFIRELVIEHVKKIYAIGSSAQKVYDYFHEIVDTEITETLEKSVRLINEKAEPNEIALLSPACASFDQFKSYEHRGEIFKNLVNNL